MEYDSENLFSGIKLVSPEELKASNDSTPDKKESEDLDTNDSEITSDVELEDQFIENNDDSPFSLVKPTRESLDDSNEQDDNISKTSDDIQNQVDDIEDEKDLDIKAKKYLALAKELQEEGILSEINEEEFNPSLEGLKELFAQEKYKQVNGEIEKYKSQFSGVKKTFLEIEDAFDSETQAIQVAKKLDFYKNIKPEAIEGNDDLSKQIYSESLKIAGFTDDEIAEYIEEASDLGKLEDKAKKALKGISSHYDDVVKKGREDQIKKQELIRKDQEDKFNSLMSDIDAKEYLIEGLPYSKVQKDKLKENITKVAYTDQNGRSYTSLGYKQMKNPKEFEMMINYYDTLGLFNVDKDGKFKPDLSKLKKVATTTASHELDKIIEQEEAKSKVKKALKSSNHSKVTDDIIAKLDRARGNNK